MTSGLEVLPVCTALGLEIVNYFDISKSHPEDDMDYS